jgi:hypothetical protein
MYDLPSTSDSDVPKTGGSFQTTPGSHKPYDYRDFFYENQEKNGGWRSLSATKLIPFQSDVLLVQKGSPTPNLLTGVNKKLLAKKWRKSAISCSARRSWLNVFR